jgi:transposase
MGRSSKTMRNRKGQPKVEVVNITIEQLEALVGRIERQELESDDYRLILKILQSYDYLTRLLQDDRVKLARLRKILFGAATESTGNVLKGKSEPSATADTSSEKELERPKGHGRNGADAYQGAAQIIARHEALEVGSPCPECGQGTLYEIPPGVAVRVTGQAPLAAKVYRIQKLRCKACGHVFKARTPAEAVGAKYDASAAAMIGLLKYGSGMPFNRVERLEGNLGVPLPASTQWGLVAAQATVLRPVYDALIRQAAQWELFHNDDTGVKILESMGLKPPGGEGASGEESKRTGTFTSVVIARCAEHEAALFFSGHQHAGENLGDVLRARAEDLDGPIQMSDGLSRNIPKDFETVVSNCLVHARRYFVDVVENFPEEVEYVLESLQAVYRVDAAARRRNLSPGKRLKLHQAKSQQVMDRLHGWLERQFDQRLVEPNSGLGQAIAYMLKHWEKLTLFLRKAGAPLDNNIAERALKRAILHRKNALFFRTAHGAAVGDLYMSLIHTCDLSGVNPFDYLVAAMGHSEDVESDPSAWLPWNYRDHLEAMEASRLPAAEATAD